MMRGRLAGRALMEGRGMIIISHPLPQPSNTHAHANADILRVLKQGRALPGRLCHDIRLTVPVCERDATGETERGLG